MKKLVSNSNGIMKSFVFLIQSNSITYEKLTTTQNHPLSSSKQPQRPTTTPTNITKIHNHPLSSSMHPQRPTTSHNHPLPPRKKLQNNPKPSTTTHKPSTMTNYHPEKSHNDPQLLITSIKASTATHNYAEKSHNHPPPPSNHPQ